MSEIIQGMTKIIDGVKIFQENVFGTKEELFQRLGKGQNPLVLFITCSDSRINPNLITQTEPGELFILRNAGNIVPPHGSGPGGEEATVEYALVQLKVRHLVVCGHSGCGAMHGLLEPQAVASMPGVARWLAYSQAVAAEVGRAGAELSLPERICLAVEKNVLVQLDHLKTYPAVSAALAAGEIKLHGWVYRFETGEIHAYDGASQRFVSLAEHHPQVKHGKLADEDISEGPFQRSI